MAGRAEVSGGILDHTATSNKRTFHHVLQLTNVAGPLVGFQPFHGPGFKFRNYTDFKLICFAFQEVMNQSGYIFFSPSEWWDHNWKYVKPKPEILAKFFCHDHFLEASMGGGNDSGIHSNGLASPDTLNFSFLKVLM